MSVFGDVSLIVIENEAKLTNIRFSVPHLPNLSEFNEVIQYFKLTHTFKSVHIQSVRIYTSHKKINLPF